MANRNNTFILKRSNVSGKKPNAGDLMLGELAINTADAILYASGTTANSILPIGWDRIARTGDTMTGTLYVPTISATTYLNLPTDIKTTGLTVSNGSVAFNRNDSMSAYTITFSGVNINVISDDTNKRLTFSASTGGSSLPTLNQAQIFIGDISNVAQARSVSGDISLNYSGLTTIQNGVVTYAKIQTTTQPCLLGSTSSGGTIEEIATIEAYIGSGSTAASLLNNSNNWTQYGVYTGTTISGTYLGQSHYNDNYWYTAIQDNIWIRLIRG